MSNCCFFEVACSPFSSAQRSHTWISDILLSWISVKCTVAGFLPQIWQSIRVPLGGPVQPPAFERQHPVGDRGQPIIVGHHDKRLPPLAGQRRR